MACAVVAATASVPAAAESADGARLLGVVRSYVVVRGDTLTSIAARAGIDVVTIVRDNHLNAGAALPVGRVLRIDNRHLTPSSTGPHALTVNIPQRMLFHRHDDGTVEAYPVAVGRRSWRTPTGPFTVGVRETNPTWDVPESIRIESRQHGRELPKSVPPGPANPLGAHWLGLSIPNVGIHGTNVPSSIYGAVTHGCIRLHPEDIARLFTEVPVGTEGRIVYEPLLLADVTGTVFLEVHPDVYRRLPAGGHELARRMAAEHGLTHRIDWDVADAVIDAREGIARVVSLPDVAQ